MVRDSVTAAQRADLQPYCTLMRTAEDARTLTWLALERGDWRGAVEGCERAGEVYREIAERARRKAREA